MLFVVENDYGIVLLQRVLQEQLSSVIESTKTEYAEFSK